MEKVAVLIGIGGAGANTIERIKDKIKIESLSVDNLEKSNRAIETNDIIFLCAGLGGNTGSYVCIDVAKKAKEKDKMVVALLYEPFSFEGTKRMSMAKEAINKIEKEVDLSMIISNDMLLNLVPPSMPMVNRFRVVDMIVIKMIEKLCNIVRNRDNKYLESKAAYRIRQEVTEELNNGLNLLNSL